MTRQKRPARRATALLATAACALAMTACGGNGADDPGSAASDAPASGPYAGLSGTVTWYETSGGSATEARKDFVLPEFTERTGVATRQDYNADATKLLAAFESGKKLPWDVIEFSSVGAFLEAREKNHLAKIDPAIVPVERLEPGAFDPYGIRGERYGIVVTWNTDVWPLDGKHPESLKDIYDTQRFPGKRCMFKYPTSGAVLESALLADGVPRDKLYPLDTKRAFAKLDTIKDDIVWFERDAPKLLSTGECDMGIGWTGQVRKAVEEDGAPLAIGWGDAVITEAVFSVPKGAPNPKAAQAMLRFFLFEDDVQRRFVEATSYPTAIKNQTFSDELTPWLPLGANLDTAVTEDQEYYRDNLKKLTDEFFAWTGS